MIKRLFEKLKDGLDKTRHEISDKLDSLLNSYGEIDEDLLEELEELLITSDVGMDTTLKIIDNLSDELEARKIKDPALVKTVLEDVLRELITDENEGFDFKNPPKVILVIGVNGAGKTTSIGKIANKIKSEGSSVLLAAADTFRAAAIDQLKVWGQRAGVEVVAHTEGSDPAAVVFDAIQAAKARNVDTLICDTAGRLQNKKNLMMELSKIHRIIDREYEGATREVLLVLDSTTGQNAISQAKIFKESADITGLVLTKLDGTSKGGFVFAIREELGIPVKFITIGEKIDDIEVFESDTFVTSLLG